MITTLRINVPHVGAKPVTGDGIIVLINSGCQAGPLVLMVDEQEKNTGASLTNAVEGVLDMIERITGISPVAMNLVELDSEGSFDQVVITGFNGFHYAVQWRPLKSGAHVRTVEAFYAACGTAATQLISHLKSIAPHINITRQPIAA